MREDRIFFLQWDETSSNQPDSSGTDWQRRPSFSPSLVTSRGWYDSRLHRRHRSHILQHSLCRYRLQKTTLPSEPRYRTQQVIASGRLTASRGPDNGQSSCGMVRVPLFKNSHIPEHHARVGVHLLAASGRAHLRGLQSAACDGEVQGWQVTMCVPQIYSVELTKASSSPVEEV